MQAFQKLTWRRNGKAEALFMHVIKNYLYIGVSHTRDGNETW